MSLRPKPISKSRATAKPVNTPANALDWISTKTNWNAVYPDAKSKPGIESTRDRPPANAVKKNSGKISDGRISAGFVKTLWMLRAAVASATDVVLERLMCAASSCAAPVPPRTRRAWLSLSRSRSRARAPRHPSLLSAGCGSPGSGRRRGCRSRSWEPVGLDQVARQRVRRQEEEHEQQREEALHRLARPRAQCGERADRAEAE